VGADESSEIDKTALHRPDFLLLFLYHIDPYISFTLTGSPISLGWIGQCETCGSIGIYRSKRIYHRLSTHLVGKQRLLCGNIVVNPRKYENYVKGIVTLDEEEEAEALEAKSQINSKRKETKLIHSLHWTPIFELIQLSYQDFCLQESDGFETEELASIRENNFPTEPSEAGDTLSQLFVDENLTKDLVPLDKSETLNRNPSPHPDPSPLMGESSNTHCPSPLTSLSPSPQPTSESKNQEDFVSFPSAMKWSLLHPISSSRSPDPIDIPTAQEAKKIVPCPPQKRLKRLLSGALKKL
jgi:hypothetical protein